MKYSFEDLNTLLLEVDPSDFYYLNRVTTHKELSAVWVRFPELSIHALEQKYTRIQKDLYLYESIVSGYKAEIKVDHNCIVQSYESEWERSNL